MSRRLFTTARKQRPRPALGMVEAVIAVLIVGTVLVAGLRAIVGAKLADAKAAGTGRAAMLAQGLLSEIVRKDYQDATNPVFGPEAGETGRATFDDVDDYNAFTESPPRDPDGSAIPGLTNWARSVKVEWITPTNLKGPASLVETGAKRVTVTVTQNNRVLATLVAIRTNCP